jgi:TolA-binding protein
VIRSAPIRLAVLTSLALALLTSLAPSLARAAQAQGFSSCRDRGKADEAAPAQAQAEVAPPQDKAPLTERQAAAEQYAEAVRRFEEEAKEYRREVQTLVEKRYDERRRFLVDNYEHAIRDLEVRERKERHDAIAQFEEFLSRYPEDAEYTPDATFRLAELYYEKANDDYALAVNEWREQVHKAVADGKEPPPEPSKSYARSIALYQRLITGFPNYRFLHGIAYLLGYCLGEMGQGEEAQRIYADLIQKYPKSPFVPEAWVRLGDWYFDEVKPDSLQRAAKAFSEMYAYPDHPLYARAIYKLGWTYYRMDDFQRAVESFAKLLDFYVALAQKTGTQPGGDVWPEAIQYTAVSFADEKWGGVERARSFFAALGGRPYEAEIYMRMGEVFFDETKYAQAVAAYKMVIAKDPLSPKAPELQARIIQAWVRDRQFDREAQEREALVAAYGEDGPWWQANKGDPDLVKDVRDQLEKNLTRSAAFHHAQAQAFKQQGKLEPAVAEYRMAARVYGAYLKRFPHSKTAYELSYNYADCLYNSLEFEQAARVYAQVRDDPADDKFAADAGLSSVISWEGEVTRLERAGQVPAYKVILSKDRKPGEEVKAEPIPVALQGLVRDSDAFSRRFAKSEKAPAIAYKAGEVFYRFGDFDEARCRFEDVVARYPTTEVAGYSANLIIESYLTMKDWAAVEESAARLQKLKLGSNNPALAASLQKFKLGGRFNRAMQLMEQKKYEDSAKLFIALVNEDPKHEFADKALYNAAFCYESNRRFESALRLYERIHSDYPKSTFADEALFRVAWNAENTYDFDKAVDRYLQLVEKYPNSKQRKDALYNAARSLENLQRYDEAAKAYARYAQLYPDAEDAARTQFHAALIYEKKKEWWREISALQEFNRRFSRSKEAELLVQAHLKMGLAFHALAQDKPARSSYGAAVAEFTRRGLKPEAAPRAAAAAAEARFRLAEFDFERFDKITLPASTNPKKLKAALSSKLAEMKRVAPAYNEVKRYKRPDWTLAAFYRQAYLLERLAQTLYEAPVPPEFKRKGQEEYLAAYQDQLAQFAQPYEEQAVAVYIQAIAAARELHVKNEWTKKISESLARYRPKEYPILKDAKGRMVASDFSPSPMAETPEGPAKREVSAPVEQPPSPEAAKPDGQAEAAPAAAGAPAAAEPAAPGASKTESAGAEGGK